MFEPNKKSLKDKTFTIPYAIDYLKLDIETEIYRVRFGDEIEEDNSYQYILVSISQAKKYAKNDNTLTEENFSHIEKLLEDDEVTLSDAYSNIFDYLCSIKNLTE